jgi:hypothetical protein
MIASWLGHHEVGDRQRAVRVASVLNSSGWHLFLPQGRRGKRQTLRAEKTMPLQKAVARTGMRAKSYSEKGPHPQGCTSSRRGAAHGRHWKVWNLHTLTEDRKPGATAVAQAQSNGAASIEAGSNFLRSV